MRSLTGLPLLLRDLRYMQKVNYVNARTNCEFNTRHHCIILQSCFQKKKKKKRTSKIRVKLKYKQVKLKYKKCKITNVESVKERNVMKW